MKHFALAICSSVAMLGGAEALKAQELASGIYEINDRLAPKNSPVFVLPTPPGAIEGGVRVGGTLVRPSVDLGAVLNSNVKAAPTPNKIAGGGRVTPQITVQSTNKDGLVWNAFAKGNYVAYANSAVDNIAEASGGVAVSDQVRQDLLLRAGFQVGRYTEDRALTFAPRDLRSPVKYNRAAGSVAADYTPGKLAVAIRYRAFRFEYEDNQRALAPGGVASQRLRTSFNQNAEATIGYQITPDVFVFAGGQYNTINYDLDPTGLRDSHGYAAYGGARINITPVLRATMAVGYQKQYHSPVFVNPRGLFYDGELEWSPRRDTIFGMRLRRLIVDSDALLSGGVVQTRIEASVAHDFRRDVRVKAFVRHDTSRIATISQTDKRWIAAAEIWYYMTPRVSFYVLGSGLAATPVALAGTSQEYGRAIIESGIRFAY